MRVVSGRTRPGNLRRVIDTSPVSLLTSQTRRRLQAFEAPSLSEGSQMIRERPSRHKHELGVVCLFCSAHIKLHSPLRAEAGPDGDEGTVARVSLLWCPVCQREAPYRSVEVIELEDAQGPAVPLD